MQSPYGAGEYTNMKTDNGQKTILQGLIKLMAESIDAFSASGRAKGAVKKCKEELAKLMTIPDKTEKCEMEKIVETAVKLDAVRADLKSREAELVNLAAVADEKRKVFDARLNAVIGDMKTKAGQETAKSWGHLVQKTVVLGLGKLNANAYRYVDPRTADSLRLSGEAYVRGHNALGKTVVYGVNARSVQDLDAELVKGLAAAETGLDANKVQEIRIARAELQKHCGFLLKMKVPKADAMKRSASVQQRQAALNTGRVKQSGSRIENVSLTMGQTAGKVPLPEVKGPKFTSPRKGGEAKK